MEIYNHIYCITYSELLEFISLGYYKKLLSEGKINRIKRACKNIEALIEFDSIPDAIKTKYISRYGDPHAQKENSQEKRELILDEKAYEFYLKTYTYVKNGISRTMEKEYAKQYAINATIIEKIIHTLDSRMRMTAKMNNARRDVWQTITGEYENWRAEYHHTLPTSINRLKDKVRQYKKDGYVALISGKLGNTSTQKIGEKEGKFIVSLRRSSVPVCTEEQIFEEFNKQAEKRGFKPLKSVQTVHLFLNKPEIKQLWFSAVFGEMIGYQAVGRKEHTQLPSMRDALWYGDGTKLNLYYKEVSLKGVKSVRTTSVYEVIDAYSEVLLGYHISDTENFEQQYGALRMAVTVSGHRPFEIVNDNQGSQNKTKTKELFTNICRVHRATSPYRGQAKTIESIFGRFQQQILHKYFNFTGQNITTVTQKSKPNLELINANVDKLPTFIELKGIYASARKEWNEMKHPATGISRIEMYNQSVNEQSPVITEFEMINIFWLFTEKSVKFTDYGITIQVAGQKYTYEVFAKPGIPDLTWYRRNTGRKFFVKYDPADMCKVELYTEDKRYCCNAYPCIKVHRAIQEQTAEEKNYLREMPKMQVEDRIEREVEGRNIAREFGTDYTQQGLKAPKLKGLSDDQNYEVERRLNTLKKPDVDIELGKYFKEISNMTFDEISDKNKLGDKKENEEKKLANLL